jgi:hypothetical protein
LSGNIYYNVGNVGIGNSYPYYTVDAFAMNNGIIQRMGWGVAARHEVPTVFNPPMCSCCWGLVQEKGFCLSSADPQEHFSVDAHGCDGLGEGVGHELPEKERRRRT